MKISLVVLTYNRAETVERAMKHNFEKAGRKIDEFVWVDNGSHDGVRDVMKAFDPDVSILHKENLGVAHGYNRGYALATGDYVVITGCDMLMPDNWLATMVEYIEKIPNTGVACMYSQPIHKVPERIRGLETTIAGLRVQPALPFGRRILRRDLLIGKIGYLREDFGLYGWEDVEWGERALRVCEKEGLLCYAIPEQIAEHLGTEGVRMHDGKDPADYHAFKQNEVRDPHKQEIMGKARGAGYPYFNSFAGITGFEGK